MVKWLITGWMRALSAALLANIYEQNATKTSRCQTQITYIRIIFITLSVNITFWKWSLLVPFLLLANKSTCIGENLQINSNCRVSSFNIIIIHYQYQPWLFLPLHSFILTQNVDCTKVGEVGYDKICYWVNPTFSVDKELMFDYPCFGLMSI